MTPKLLTRFEMESAPSPTASVIMLHGLGANGHDLAGIVPEMDLQGCQPMRFVFPHAPSMPVTVNAGYVMPAWYDIYGFDLVSRQDAQGIAQSELAITALVAHEIQRGIAADHIVLAGFSQGAAMALHTGLRLPYSIAGVIALSGYMPLADRFPLERSPANAFTPIFMGHGRNDTVVIHGRGETSRNQLQDLGYTVQWHSYPTEHNITAEEVDDVTAFLRQILPEAL
jgi:phospholipase/carboxylesterase